MLRSRLSTSVSAALLLGMVSLTGCGANHSADSNNVHTNSVKGNNGGRIQTNAVRGNTYDKMEMSQELADHISAMPEVKSANVMLVGRSAYVAVKLDDTNGKPRNIGTRNYRSYSYDAGHASGILPRAGNMGGMDKGHTTGGAGSMDNGYRTSGRGSVTGTPGVTGMGGSMDGVPKSLTGTGTVGGTGMTDPQAYPGNGGNGILSGSNFTDGTRMKRDIDDSVGSGIGIRSVAPNNNYRMNTSDDVTSEMKDRIAAEVKKVNPSIKNVYVSANPDFVERADYYAREARAGHPLKGFAKEFGTMVERIFPTRSGY
ncbi:MULTISPECIES: YhcN/YlaJ family sporulation lipoprotein [unclassified Paenibacillus]|uniref:YhcN/YlaJ family sporulation lipoprotein n=1 Tax=unclassified Paenibacillus TaxID=185978 RepID=UPI002406B7D3|nr:MULTISPECIES: YhcN/YlaJ family sporulation lipoprotein [unclassified Paenibacillus]